MGMSADDDAPENFIPTPTEKLAAEDGIAEKTSTQNEAFVE